MRSMRDVSGGRGTDGSPGYLSGAFGCTKAHARGHRRIFFLPTIPTWSERAITHSSLYNCQHNTARDGIHRRDCTYTYTYTFTFTYTYAYTEYNQNYNKPGKQQNQTNPNKTLRQGGRGGGLRIKVTSSEADLAPTTVK